MTDSIMSLTPEEAIDVYEGSGVKIATTVAKDFVMSMDNADTDKALAVGMEACDSFRDFILSHSRCEPSEHTETKFHYAACTMLWMDRVHRYIESKGRDQFPEGPLTFIDHVTAYSLLSSQTWGEACEELLVIDQYTEDPKEGGEA
tara:strand:- start:240 stop:677 length:438 start_codon:yes stop_codon:yes gene_type:complete